MYQKFLVMFLLIFLLSHSFSMSGDGNVPVVKEGNVHDVVSQTLQQTESNVGSNEKSNETVKDRFGVDTGMTKEHFQEFETNYLKKCEQLGIQKYPRVSPKSYFEHKINLNVVDELKELGLFLTKDPFLPDEGLAYNITHSDLIVIGILDSYEYLYKTRAEEWENHTRSRYFVEVEKVLKKEEFIESIPNRISFSSSIGKHIISSGEQQLKIGQKYIFFFQAPKSPLNALEIDFYKMRFSSVRVEQNKTYLLDSSKEYMKNYDELLSLIKKYNKLNDVENFYNRKYLSEEAKNEK